LGLRIGEALALRWSCVDWDSAQVEVGPSLTRKDRRWIVTGGKSHRTTRMPLPTFALDALRAHRRRQAAEQLAAGPLWQPELDDLVFTREDGRPLLARSVQRRLDKVCDAAGVPRRSLHGLRHQCAALLIAQGATMAEVQLTLRHATQAMTSSVYASLMPEVAGRNAERMQRMVDLGEP
jgi:integrase